MKGVIFDMDGTLFDSESIWQDIWYRLPQDYGYPVNDKIGKDMCGTNGKFSEQVAKNHYPDLDPAEFVARGREEYRNRLLAKQPQEKPGLHEIVKHLKKEGYKLAVASGSDLIIIEENVRRAGMSDDFDALVSGNEVSKGKPSPDIFLEAAKRLGLPPKECYVVEDGENGIRAAYAAGCTPIMVPDTIAPTEEMRQKCMGIFDSLADLVKVI